MASTEVAIRTTGLTKDYGTVRGVTELTLEVAAGEVFGFLGPNGAGKTTTIRTLLGLLRPTSGTAEVLGHDIVTGSLDLRRHVGYVPGEYGVYDRLTGHQFLRHMDRLRGRDDSAAAADLARRFACDLDRPLGDLSRGNKQKVGLIQALMHDPGLLILDEPTSGLDPLVQQTFNDIVRERRDAGRTVFLSSHVLPEVEAVCERVAILRDGRLLTVENVATLKAEAARRLDITFAEPVDASAFEGLPGVLAAEAEGTRLLLTVKGAHDAVVKAAAHYPVVTFTSEAPRLEDTFLKFYGRDDHAG